MDHFETFSKQGEATPSTKYAKYIWRFKALTYLFQYNILYIDGVTVNILVV